MGVHANVKTNGNTNKDGFYLLYKFSFVGFVCIVSAKIATMLLIKYGGNKVKL